MRHLLVLSLLGRALGNPAATTIEVYVDGDGGEEEWVVPLDFHGCRWDWSFGWGDWNVEVINCGALHHPQSEDQH